MDSIHFAHKIRKTLTTNGNRGFFLGRAHVKSMRIALEDLKLDHIAVLYPGSSIFPLAEKITAYGLETIASGEFIQHLLK